MLRESVVLVRSKMLLDLALLNAIILIIQTTFIHPGNFLSSSHFLLVLLTNMITWLSCARAFGLYGDLRLKLFSVEWIMFLKAFGLYALLTSFIAFQVLGRY